MQADDCDARAAVGMQETPGNEGGGGVPGQSGGCPGTGRPMLESPGWSERARWALVHRVNASHAATPLAASPTNPRMSPARIVSRADVTSDGLHVWPQVERIESS